MSDNVRNSRSLSFSKNRRILIIDDEDDIRQVAAVALEVVAGWQVSQARSGAEGITLAQVEMPDAILLDVQMPVVDGPATLKMLREYKELSQIPVFFLTARVQAADRNMLGKVGVVAILSKPFDPLVLAGTIADVLKWD